jgi:hypothetical protein
LTPFSIFSATEPRRLLLDPETEVFRVLAPDEVPVTVNSIKGSKQLLAVMTEDCRTGEEIFKRLLESLGKKNTTVIREDLLDTERMRGHDLIFCGIPKQRPQLPPLPAKITLHSAGFSINKEVVNAPDGLLFMVLPLPAPSGRVAAFFRPLSAAAAEQYTPKITHYGKYGSLVFSGGAIQHKGTTPASAKTSSISF